MYSRDIVDAGDVDPNNITDIQAELMLAYALDHGRVQSVDRDAVLMPAGKYKQYLRGLSYVFRLSHPIRYCGVLDPQAILPSQQEGLKALLAKASKEKALAAGEYIVAVTINGRQELQLYKLASTLSARKKFDDVDYYDVLDNSDKFLLGGGHFGRVYIVPGTIKPRFFNSNDMFFSPGNQKRIAKLQEHNRRRTNTRKKPFSRLTGARREADLLRRSSSSRVRDLNLLVAKDQDEAVSIISMRRYDGNNLTDVLDYNESVCDILNDQLKMQTVTDKLHACSSDPMPLMAEYNRILSALCEKINVWAQRRLKLNPYLRAGLTVKDRIELSISLLREYQLEIQNNHILHRDLKSDNIFLEKTGLKFQPRMIDFGLSCDQSSDSQLHKTVGALLYRAPEAIDRPNTLKSDAYALMRIVALIWGDKELYSNEVPGVSRITFSRKRKNEKVINYDLFSGLDLDEKIEKMIEQVIRFGTLWDPALRNEIADDIFAFEAIRLEFYKNGVNPAVHEAITDAHRKAFCLAEGMAASGSSQSLDDIANRIINMAATISQHPQAIEIFVKTLAIRTLYGCRSLNEIIDTVNGIRSRYQSIKGEYTARLEVLRNEADQFGIDSYQKYLDQCGALIDKLSSQAVTLDVESDITNHLIEKLMKMNEASRYYRKIMDEKEMKASQPRPVRKQ